MQKITPNIMVADVNTTVKWYKDNLGFELLMGVNEQKEVKMGNWTLENTLIWAMIKKDAIEIMLQRKDSFVEELPELKGLEIGGTFTLYISMKNTKDFYEQIQGKVEFVKEIHKTFYGADEFVIRDVNGYILYFAEAQNG